MHGCMCIPAILPSRRARTPSASMEPTSRRCWTAAGIPRTSAAGILSGKDMLLVFSAVRISTSLHCRSGITNRDPYPSNASSIPPSKNTMSSKPGASPPDHSWSSAGLAISGHGPSKPQHCGFATETRLRFSDFLPAVFRPGRQTGARRPDRSPPARFGHQAIHPVAR